MKLLKMLLISLMILAIVITLVNVIYWFTLNTTIGKYVLLIVFIGIWYGISKLVISDKPKESIL